VKLHGTAYLNDWTDVQVSAPANLTGPYFAIENIDSAEALGAELELEASLSRGFIVTAGGSWTDTDLQDGRSFPRTPEWSFHVSPRYSFTLASSSRFTVGADWSYRDDVYHDAWNSPQIVQKGFGLLNARVSYTAPSEFWSVAVYGTNLTDEEYLEAAYVSPYGAAIGTVGRPLVLGVKFRIIYTQQ
jgi:iron complex outermembrane receptor protein